MQSDDIVVGVLHYYLNSNILIHFFVGGISMNLFVRAKYKVYFWIFPSKFRGAQHIFIIM